MCLEKQNKTVTVFTDASTHSGVGAFCGVASDAFIYASVSITFNQWGQGGAAHGLPAGLCVSAGLGSSWQRVCVCGHRTW